MMVSEPYLLYHAEHLALTGGRWALVMYILAPWVADIIFGRSAKQKTGKLRLEEKVCCQRCRIHTITTRALTVAFTSLR